ncbi:hypothetical protein SFSGTM_10390 [Sulfuriferula nivalis]|uniref:Uncharacterized protein n=1 Tax=Sulfuriferula nivalis TaxID=2675298 RepID=A0A809RNE3_9PROT|nr:hypothetical protein SFSGTM_10390 [Sulfuriferula nivalis]
MLQVSSAHIVAALQKCLNFEPTINYCLSPDASSLAAILAEMNYFKQEIRTIESLSSGQQEVVMRWL